MSLKSRVDRLEQRARKDNEKGSHVTYIVENRPGGKKWLLISSKQVEIWLPDNGRKS